MVCLALATPVAKTCDAAGGAFRPHWREWPGRDYWANLVRAGTLANAAVCNICITSPAAISRFRVILRCCGVARESGGVFFVLSSLGARSGAILLPSRGSIRIPREVCC